MAEITVVGVGPGSKEYLTQAAEYAVTQADILIGGRRQLDLFNNLNIKKYPITKELDTLFIYIDENIKKCKKIVILASGDPGFYGILATLKRRFPDINIITIPGISSVQLACAKLGITWDDAYLTSCHGRDISPILEAVKVHNKVITLTDPQHNPAQLAQALLDAGAGERIVFVACNLSYPDESLTKISLQELASIKNWQKNNCIMVIINES